MPPQEELPKPRSALGTRPLDEHRGRGAELTGPCVSYRNAPQLFPITINLIRIMDRKCPSVANAVWHQLTEIL